MLAYAAIAQLALDQFPGSSTPPTPPRPNPQGVVAIVDAAINLTYGTVPVVNAPFALIINMPSSALIAPMLTFVSPSGKVKFSDQRYVSVNSQNLLGYDQLQGGHYIVYQTAVNEFNESGIWQVFVTSGASSSLTYFFRIGAVN